MKCASITNAGTPCTNNVLSGLGTVEHQGMIFRLCRIHAEAWARGTWTPNWDRAERKPRHPQSEQPMLPVEFGPITQAYLDRTPYNSNIQPGPMSDSWVEPEDDGPEIHESISVGQQRAGAHLYRVLLKKGMINAANNVTIGRGMNAVKVCEVIHKIN